MSLLAEYSIRAELVLGEPWTVTAFYKGKEIGKEIGVYTIGIEPTGARMINEHMAAVTRSLGLGSRERVTEEEDEEQDRLAHKADHDNQCERDRE